MNIWTLNIKYVLKYKFYASCIHVTPHRTKRRLAEEDIVDGSVLLSVIVEMNGKVLMLGRACIKSAEIVRRQYSQTLWTP